MARGGTILEVTGLSKSFPGVRALEEVDLEVARGSVHALMGANGAGKSTLAACLSGLRRPDAGRIALRGRAVRLRGPHDALRLGIAMVHQELSPFPELSVAENICMGREPTRWAPGWLDRAAMRRQARGLLERLGADLPPTRLMKRLSVAEMQLVEIAKALAWRAEVLILDEPTSALAAREAEALFAMIGELRQAGVAVIYITHKLEEVFRLADTVTVLRDGRLVASHPISELDPTRLIGMMLGNAECGMGNAEWGSQESGVRRQNTEDKIQNREDALEVRGLGKAGKFRGVSFSVRRGEVLGIAGMMGAGRTELVSAIYGLAPADSGEILVDGRAARIRRPAEAMREGIAFVGEDRKQTGLVPQMPVAHNITLAALARCCRGPWIRRRAERRVAEAQMRALSIRARGPGQRVGTLSGGNQQKVVLARALLTGPEILILDEPTRGIDVGAKAEVHGLIRELARAGKTVIVVSSEMEEILALSDRILVLRGGEIAAELDAATTTQEEILRYAMPAVGMVR